MYVACSPYGLVPVSKWPQDHADALALVSVNNRPETTNSQPTPGVKGEEAANDDLRRAKELVDLHYEIKAKHANGSVDEELVRARVDVSRVLRELGA